MRYLLGFLGFFALGLALMAGCSDENGEGGGGGTAGTGMACQTAEDCPDGDMCTIGGPGTRVGIDCINSLCFYTPLDCYDGSDCTVDTCDSATGCERTLVPDGTACAGGLCQSGMCELAGSELPCTEPGIRNAIAAGGGPYTFDCDGWTQVETRATIFIGNDVILDGENNLEVDGNYDHPLFQIDDATVELRGFILARGRDGTRDPVASAINSVGRLTLSDTTVTSNYGRGSSEAINIWGGSLTAINSMFAGNRDGAIACVGNGILEVTNSTFDGEEGELISGCSSLEVTNSTLVGDLTFPEPGVNQGATLKNTLIQGQCTNTVISAGYNVESEGDTCGFDQPTDLVNVSADDLALGPLNGNGGSTQTHALFPGSVAIDLIPEPDCVDADGEPLTTDQRGFTRPVAILGPDPKCDVGAFEVQP